MTAEAGIYRGMTRSACREKLLKDLTEEGYLKKIEDYSHSVGHCYRCGSMIEPMLSRQWFVRMKPLAEPAIQAVEEGRIQIVPQHWEKTYFDWMQKIAPLETWIRWRSLVGAAFGDDAAAGMSASSPRPSRLGFSALICWTGPFFLDPSQGPLPLFRIRGRRIPLSLNARQLQL